MERVKLGQTPFEISRIGLGTWAIGGGEYQSGWGPQDDQASVATIRAALASGINRTAGAAAARAGAPARGQRAGRAGAGHQGAGMSIGHEFCVVREEPGGLVQGPRAGEPGEEQDK
jgi:hypothetical protein